MYIRKIIIAISIIIFFVMGGFSYYIYNIMFASNTNFSEDFRYIYIKTGSDYNDLTNNLAQAVEAWTQKQTFNITDMVCPINIEQAQHVNPTMGSGGGTMGPVMIPSIQLQPVMTQGTAEIGQSSILSSQGTNAFDAIDTSGVKLQYPEMTSDESARETVNSEE